VHVKLAELPLEFHPSHRLESLGIAVALLSKPRNAGQRNFVWRPRVLGGYLNNTTDRQTAFLSGIETTIALRTLPS